MGIPPGFGRGRAAITIATALALAAPLPAAHAQSGQNEQSESEQHRGENGGNGGKPLAVTVNYASDLNADVAGGQSRGLVYLGRASVLFDADLDKLIVSGAPGPRGWRGLGDQAALEAGLGA